MRHRTPVAAPIRSHDGTEYEYRPTGCLELCIDRRSYGSLAKVSEASGRKLENRLNEVVVKLLRLVDKAQIAQERARVEREQKAVRKKIAIEKEIVKRMDEVRIAWIEETLPRWEAAQRLRPFIEAVRQTASLNGAVDKESEFTQSLVWATAYVESLDPLANLGDLPTYSLNENQISLLREQCDSEWCDHSEQFIRKTERDRTRWNE